MKRIAACVCLLFVLGCGESEEERITREAIEQGGKQIRAEANARIRAAGDESHYKFFPEHRETDRMADRIADRIYERMREDGTSE